MSAAAASTSWLVGEDVVVRGRRWTIAGITHGGNCSALRLREPGTERLQTLLTPFDRPQRIHRSRAPRLVRPRRWLHDVDRVLIDVHAFGSLTATARSAIRLIPYQLEPALAVLRYGQTRILVADDVGLGKTIQAGILLLELASRADVFRGLVLVPAGLREQWAQELSGHFGLTTTIADASWLRSTAARHPPDVNPWSLPGIYISSHDFVKRPEVLRPLEAVTWDLIVVDEAHAVTSGTNRRAAIHALAVRSRRVMMLTATPHAGDPVAFDALGGIGCAGTSEAPLMLFRRHRSDLGAGTAPKRALLSIVPSNPERHMHALLERYSRQMWREATERRDDRARLASIVLRKRALSSAGSLAASTYRRLELLTSRSEPDAVQLALPISDDEDPLDDDAPSAALAAPGFSDPKRERSWLSAIGEAARLAARAETKARFLLRLLGRIREPAIVFTEYRDTLVRLERHLATPGRSLVLLHGGMTAAERAHAQRVFNERGGVLLATDAASEGLNLHDRCRIVVHYELPWNPSRLQQRAGRVDRFGQTRRVHEIALVAADTAERLVLAPLAARAARARVMGAATGVIDALSESRVAEIVMTGMPSDPERQVSHAPVASALHVVTEVSELRALARHQVTLLERQRRLLARSHSHGSASGHRPVVATPKPGCLSPGIYLLYVLSVSTVGGHRLHAETLLLQLRLANTDCPLSREDLRHLIAGLTELPAAPLAARIDQRMGSMLDDVALLYLRAHGRLVEREHVVARERGSVARELVQPGLFDRSLRKAAARDRDEAAGRQETADRLSELAAAASIRPDAQLVAALIVRTR